MGHHRIVVDVESTGLDPLRHIPIEVAWLNLETGASGHFIPPHTARDIRRAEPRALEINRYAQRIAGRKQDDGAETLRLHQALTGSTLCGANPAFDAAMLSILFRRHRAGWWNRLLRRSTLDPAPWHYRLWDVSAYAAGVLGLDVLPGLAWVCSKLNVEPGDHTAVEDVRATAECFRALTSWTF